MRHVRHRARVPRADVAVRAGGRRRIVAPRGHRRAEARRVEYGLRSSAGRP